MESGGGFRCPICGKMCNGLVVDDYLTEEVIKKFQNLENDKNG